MLTTRKSRLLYNSTMMELIGMKSKGWFSSCNPWKQIISFIRKSNLNGRMLINSLRVESNGI